MGRTQELESRLEEMKRIPNEVWIETLEHRKRVELEFHDRDRNHAFMSSLEQDDYERIYGNKKYYSMTTESKGYLEEWIRRNARGKVFLDYACGNGLYAICAAKAGAALAIGIDISSISILNATENARREGVEAVTRFVQADAEATTLPSHSIDTIVCVGMLHHLDLSFAFPELRRILAKNGKILAFESLRYNPLIALYRKITPEMRTEWEKEHILGLADLRFARRFFDIGEVKYWHVLSILGPHVPALAGVLNAVDRQLTRIPVLRLLSWIFTFELRSKA